MEDNTSTKENKANWQRKVKPRWGYIIARA